MGADMGTKKAVKSWFCGFGQLTIDLHNYNVKMWTFSL